MKESVVRDKSFAFALRVIRLCQNLQEQKREYVISKQLLRSGTAIGALIREADQAESRADFIHKMAIALKEANETEYWVELLQETNYIEPEDGISMRADLTELLRLLTSIVKSTRANTNPNKSGKWNS
jgi:four helix bundle protein